MYLNKAHTILTVYYKLFLCGIIFLLFGMKNSLCCCRDFSELMGDIVQEAIIETLEQVWMIERKADAGKRGKAGLQGFVCTAGFGPVRSTKPVGFC